MEVLLMGIYAITFRCICRFLIIKTIFKNKSKKFRLVKMLNLMVESLLRSCFVPKIKVFSIFFENSFAFLEITELLSTFFWDCKKNQSENNEIVKIVIKPCNALAFATYFPFLIAETAIAKNKTNIKKKAYFSMKAKIKNTLN